MYSINAQTAKVFGFIILINMLVESPTLAEYSGALITTIVDNQDDSGIIGQVIVRPIRPHATIGVPNFQPYQATVDVLDPSGHLVTTIQTDAAGNFRVSLSAGKYVLRPKVDGPYPRASEQAVTVVSKTFTQIRIIYDTGIR